MKLEEEFKQIQNTSSVNEIQDYVANMIQQRGFEKETLKDVMILLTEEVGELAKAVRKSYNMKMDVDKKEEYNLREEIADVFNYLLSMCCVLDIHLIDCWKEKEQQNLKRNWK